MKKLSPLNQEIENLKSKYHISKEDLTIILETAKELISYDMPILPAVRLSREMFSQKLPLSSPIIAFIARLYNRFYSL